MITHSFLTKNKPLPEPGLRYAACLCILTRRQVLLARKLGLVCHFRSPACTCPHVDRSAHSFALRFPSGKSSRIRTCLRIVFMVLSSRQYPSSDTGDFHTIRSGPCRAYTIACPRPQKRRGFQGMFSLCMAAFAVG